MISALISALYLTDLEEVVDSSESLSESDPEESEGPMSGNS